MVQAAMVQAATVKPHTLIMISPPHHTPDCTCASQVACYATPRFVTRLTELCSMTAPDRSDTHITVPFLAPIRPTSMLLLMPGCHEMEGPGSRRVSLCFGCCWRYCRNTHLWQQGHIPEAHRSLQSISKALQGKPPQLFMLHRGSPHPIRSVLAYIGAS